MKTCVINGDMSSERSSENYPTVQVCDECLTADEERKEDQQVVSVDEYDASFGNTCEFCDKTHEEEQQENTD